MGMYLLEPEDVPPEYSERMTRKPDRFLQNKLIEIAQRKKESASVAGGGAGAATASKRSLEARDWEPSSSSTPTGKAHILTQNPLNGVLGTREVSVSGAPPGVGLGSNNNTHDAAGASLHSRVAADATAAAAADAAASAGGGDANACSSRNVKARTSKVDKEEVGIFQTRFSFFSFCKKISPSFGLDPLFFPKKKKKTSPIKSCAPSPSFLAQSLAWRREQARAEAERRAEEENPLQTLLQLPKGVRACLAKGLGPEYKAEIDIIITVINENNLSRLRLTLDQAINAVPGQYFLKDTKDKTKEGLILALKKRGEENQLSPEEKAIWLDVETIDLFFGEVEFPSKVDVVVKEKITIDSDKWTIKHVSFHLAQGSFISQAIGLEVGSIVRIERFDSTDTGVPIFRLSKIGHVEFPKE